MNSTNSLSKALAIRGIFSVVLGLVFVAWPGVVVSYLVLALGILLVLGAGIPMIYAAIKKYPISYGNIPGLILGVLLLAFPAFFVSVIMYMLGIILILAGLNQLLSYSAIKRAGGMVPGYYYIFPIIMLVSGIIVLFNPFASLATLFMYFGFVILFYGITEIIAAVQTK